MKKMCRLWMAVCLFLVAASGAFAAEVPARSGVVTDPIGLFTTEEIREIEAGVSGREYELIVLTSSGLSERDGEQLAHDAYDEWSLTTNELMLVITVDPNYVHLVYDSAVLSERVAKTDARDAKGIIDQTFVPLAVDGRVSEGVIAISDFVHALPALTEPGTPSPPATSLPNTNAPTNQVQPDSANDAGKLSLTAVIIFFSVILIGIVLLFVLKQVMTARRIKARLVQAKALHSEGNGIISKLMLSELFKELEMGFIQGETKRHTADLEQAVLRLHKAYVQLGERLERHDVSWRSGREIENRVEHDLQELTNAVGRAKQLAGEVERLQQLSIEIRRAVEQAKKNIGKMNDELEKTSQETGCTLQDMRRQLAEIQSSLDEADHLDEFDFLQAKGKAASVQERLDEFAAQFELWKKQRDAGRSLADRIEACRVELRKLARQEQLMLTDRDPFAVLQQAENMLVDIEQSLDAGDMDALTQNIALVEQGIQQAKDIVEKAIRHRDKATKMLMQINAFFGEWDGFAASVERDDTVLRNHYVIAHVHEQQMRFAQMQEEKKKLEKLKSDLEQALDTRVQQYERAEQLRGEAAVSLDQMQQWKQASMSFVSRLEQAWREAKERFEMNKQLYTKTVALMERLNGRPYDELLHVRAEAEMNMRQAEEALQQAQRDLKAIQSSVATFEASVKRFVQLAEQLHQQQENSLRAFRKFQQDYRYRMQRYGNTLNSATYRRRYSSMQSTIEQMIMAGMFLEAMKHITAGNDLLKQMDREYRRRRQEEERRRHMGGPHGGGWGGPFGGGGFGGGGPFDGGGGHSGGSSGWGGGGRSGGSSGWGGGGGRSSGSSKW